MIKILMVQKYRSFIDNLYLKKFRIEKMKYIDNLSVFLQKKTNEYTFKSI
jgi:hypothetical protein